MTLSPEALAVIVDGLAMAVLVFRRNRLIYTNAAAKALVERLRSSYRIELEMMLRDHVTAVLEHRDGDGARFRGRRWSRCSPRPTASRSTSM